MVVEGLHNLVGLTGVTMILIAYFLLQTERMSQANPYFSLINAGGSALILISLSIDFNLPSAVIELSWMLLSILGLIRALRNRKNRSTQSADMMP